MRLPLTKSSPEWGAFRLSGRHAVPICLSLRDVRLRGPGDQVSPAVKTGAVAGTVPALLVRVPCQLTAQMRAADAYRIQRSVLRHVCADLFPVQPHHAAVTGRKPVSGFLWDREEGSGEILHGVPALL